MVIRLVLLAVGLGLLPGLLVLAHTGFSLLSLLLCGVGPLLCLGALLCLARAAHGYRD